MATGQEHRTNSAGAERAASCFSFFLFSFILLFFSTSIYLEPSLCSVHMYINWK